MKRRFTLLLSLVASFSFASGFFSVSDLIKTATSKSSTFKVNDLRVGHPENWTLKQTAEDNGVQIFGFQAPEGYLMFFSREGGLGDLKSVFVNNSTIINESTYFGDLAWKQYLTQKTTADGRSKTYVASFASDYRGKSYYGYAMADSIGKAHMLANDFVTGIAINTNRSLTSAGFPGKKYYLGFGAAMSGDPSMMHNEVKYDVLHTHDIFTKDVGGSYQGIKYTSYKDATSTNIKARWAEYKSSMTKDDMYVQYSSGHGSPSGLAVGVSYNEIRDAVLSFGAKENVILIMACNSGGLVNAFNAKKAEWENFPSQDRTLFVLASSAQGVNSSTGPGTDPEEPGGANGSAGSAFGHAIWKALIGYADGYNTGVKDGYLSLDEILKFTTWKTEEVGDHKPVSTGAYNPQLVMNRVPPKAFLDMLEHSTEGLSEEEVIRQIQELDAAMRL